MPYYVLGVTGFGAGRLYSYLKEQPLDEAEWRPVVMGVAFAGFVGSAVGMGVGWYRNKQLYIYTASLGANATLATASFLGMHFAITILLLSLLLLCASQLRRYSLHYAKGGKWYSTETTGAKPDD